MLAKSEQSGLVWRSGNIGLVEGPRTYAMRHYLQMLKDLKGKELLARHTTYADRTVLREFADLAERLGFESPEIVALKEHL